MTGQALVSDTIIAFLNPCIVALMKGISMSASTGISRQHHRPPVLLLAAFFLIGLTYLWATPVFEAPDESHHFAFADYISRHRSLPLQQPGEATPWAHEASQPPLYHILVAALISPINKSDLQELARPNPHAILGDPSATINRNLHLHDHASPQLKGAELAVYVARLFSLCLSCGSVAAVWYAARELAFLTGRDPGRLALLAAGLIAFMPQFLFISASVNNDNLITLLTSLIIWQLLAMLRKGLVPGRSLVLALLLALASLSKLSGLPFYLPVLITSLYLARRHGNARELVRMVLLMSVCWLLIASPWYAHNLSHYGELTGAKTTLDIYGRRPAPGPGQLLGEEFNGLRISYQGLFGHFNVFAPAPLYLIMDSILLAGIVGLLPGLWQLRKRQEAVFATFLLALCFILVLGALVVYTLQTNATQGRLLFPTVAASSALLGLGLMSIGVPAKPILFALAGVAILIPWTSIRPAYGRPAIVAELPVEATAQTLYFDDIVMVGHHIPKRQYGPGETIPVTFYWSPLRRSGLDFSFYLHLLNSVDRVLVSNYGFPGRGSLQTSRWEPGVIYQDLWELQVPEDARGHTSLRVQIGWWKYPEGLSILATTGDGAIQDPVRFDAGSFRGSNVADELPLEHAVWPLEFGNSIRLLAWEQNGPDITLLWEATARPAPDLQVFVHVLNNPVPGEPDLMLAQGDSPPLTPTADWQPGERYLTHHSLEMSAATDQGVYRMYVGWYHMSHGWRLKADCPFNFCPLAMIRLPF